jgi:hypothetical protein
VLCLHHVEQRAGQSSEKLDHRAHVVEMIWTRPSFEGAPGAAAPPATTSSGSSTARLLIGLEEPAAREVVTDLGGRGRKAADMDYSPESTLSPSTTTSRSPSRR